MPLLTYLCPSLDHCEQQGRLAGIQIVVDWTRCGRFEVLYAALVLDLDDHQREQAMLLYARAYFAGQMRGKRKRAEQELLSQTKAAFAGVTAQK